jgi:hypothetical protein
MNVFNLNAIPSKGKSMIETLNENSESLLKRSVTLFDKGKGDFKVKRKISMGIFDIDERTEKTSDDGKSITQIPVKEIVIP